MPVRFDPADPHRPRLVPALAPDFALYEAVRRAPAPCCGSCILLGLGWRCLNDGTRREPGEPACREWEGNEE